MRVLMLVMLVLTLVSAVATVARMAGNRRPWTLHCTMVPFAAVFAYAGWLFRTDPLTGPVGLWFYACAVGMFALWLLETYRLARPWMLQRGIELHERGGELFYEEQRHTLRTNWLWYWGRFWQVLA